ncbi:MAG: 23S rRNA (uracil(1939)-C(5))-methyltransferase RlmD [Peptoniphilus sp.]|uniref:23S rRNA (uracil(1939)-C(5))-methyltransferase RlmD n=1 Tax=Peptoniphilus sp. TaxID=1971214 RepID=UPI0025F2C3DE|nr:23S rRNA (uracil(1939)-C(5))-methyltransferase RlmD [Peptoniphilus sp.]MCI5643257.1 23S rRNA (uracil(1939)-C(5))-methyltransferase RlmD [Peptoniphilus sp.]MDD7352594.1 23S rRNA (uracil(1939)-C(5))-methyltransferase RlmD [Peptoniphilaceae bacterium]MDY3902997.1 23S rRNA (uracil(1939)-C(5))-methyltransferase RlmD [Peptoniphilus sp.]
MEENKFIREIIDFDFKGLGMTKVDGLPVFLDGGVIGDEVEFLVTKKKKNFCKGEIQKIIKKSKDRVNSPCPYFKDCGGCDFLNYSDEKELKWKEKDINKNLNKIAGLDIKVQEVIDSPEKTHYRNNMQFQVRDSIIGLYAKNSKDIVAIKNCIMQKDIANEVLKIMWRFKKLRELKRIGIRTNFKGEVLLILVTKGAKVEIKDILPELIDVGVKSIYLNYNTGDKFHYSREFEKIYGEDFIEEKLLDINYRISPESFFQINRLATEKLYEKAIEYLDPKAEDKIYDLYCGVGSISISIAKKLTKVIGIEIVESAVDDARINAENNNIEARFIKGAAEETIEKIYREEKISPNKIIVDPPRKGLDDKLVNFLKENPVESLVYISCNPATQARDLKSLKEVYKVKKIALVNLFPNTAHVECVALMSRNRV